MGSEADGWGPPRWARRERGKVGWLTGWAARAKWAGEERERKHARDKEFGPIGIPRFLILFRILEIGRYQIDF